jgi:hypothetical protein
MSAHCYAVRRLIDVTLDLEEPFDSTKVQLNSSILAHYLPKLFELGIYVSESVS